MIQALLEREKKSLFKAVAAVISQTGRYLGVVFARDIERRISDSVLTTHRG